MGDKDKLEYAWDQLEHAEFDSEHYQAAYEYIDNISLYSVDPRMYNKLRLIDQQRWQEWAEALGGAYQSDSEDNPLQ
jgi:hypothetical protein